MHCITVDYTHIAKVWIVISRANATVVLDILEGIVHQPAIAARIAILPGAIHKLLLTQTNQLTVLAEVLSFQCPCGTECPARTTLALVLHLWREKQHAPCTTQ